MTDGLAEVMKATGNQHDPVGKARFGVAKAVFDDPYPFHPSQNMLDHDTDLAHSTVVLPFLLGSLLARLLLDWLVDDHACGREGLKSTILMQFTVRWKAEIRSFGHCFVVHRAGYGIAQEAHFVLSEVSDDHIFIRVRFFLPL